MKDIESHISFVEYTKTFLDKSYEWLNDPEIKYLTDTPDFTKEAQKKWFDSLEKRSDYKVWGIIFDNKPIGVVGLKHIDLQQQSAEYFGYIGEKKYWGHGIGKLMISYSITEVKKLNLQSLYLNVIKTNIRALNLYKKFNFSFVENKNSRLLLKRVFI